ncbi:putative DNA double-strand break repair rad50 ATPase [Corchorus olitorius]|uniref:DNA double-strand break repair rad50 ATPase n=1 Tax=Corchorus olitorius TaxID=93759 RepID=A0A1R3JIL8_9ROSI|nr:putative DNA double-strand break repair rad50 ATPase [Corchorus olitorius]
MFTPQKKVWSNWSLTPGKKVDGSGSDPDSNGVALGKGKGAAFAEPVTPNGNGLRLEDHEGVPEKVVRLEAEISTMIWNYDIVVGVLNFGVALVARSLFEYQYNMGLLLIEKKEWTSKFEELSKALIEAKDALKREQAAHLIAMNDVEKREENLSKALGIEKQCVLDLEKALRDMRSETAEIKFTADSKLSEANALIASVEEKSLEVEAKLRAADAKLAEPPEWQETHEATLSKQREDLREWEKKLQDAEERLAKGQRYVNQREERANENDRLFKQKEKDLEEAQKKIDAANQTLKEKEDDINSRLANLTVKEKEWDVVREKLEMKEKDLLEIEEKLNAREKVEIQKLLDEHNAILDERKREFELEIDEKRKSLDAELKSKVIEVEKKEIEVKHMEEKLSKREQAADKKLEKFKEKEKEFEIKVKNHKEREKAMRSEEKNLEIERKQILAEKEDLLSLKAEVEKIRVENEEKLLKLHEEEDRLRVTEEERSEYLRLQSELKGELEKCRHREELLLKEAEDLKRQKENFEREWEELDEKRLEIEKELKNINQQTENFEKQKLVEEERLKNEKQKAEDYIKRELEALEDAKQTFAATMEHERSVIAERAESERSQRLHDLELQKRKLESDMQSRYEEMEKELGERKKSFEEEKERELDNINYLREVARREMEELKQERLKVDKERQEVNASKMHLEGQQIEIRRDIDDLVGLSKKLKDQREQFINERNRFISFVEKHKSCKNCGEMTSAFMLSDLQSLQEMENEEVPPLPTLADDYIGNLAASERQKDEISPVAAGSPISGGTMSWLRKCTSKIFKFSPGKGIGPHAITKLNTEDPHSGGEVNMEGTSKVEYEPELSFAAATESLDIHRVQSETSTRDVDGGQDFSIDNQSNIDSKELEVLGDSQTSDLNHGKQLQKRGRPKARRTRSVKAVVRDAEAVLGRALESNELEHPSNGNIDSGLADGGTSRNARKRNRAQSSKRTESEQDDVSEGHDSVAAGQPRKRRQKVVLAMPTPGETRYNLRRPKTGVTVAKTISDTNREKEVGKDAGDQINYSEAPIPASENGAANEHGGADHFLQRCETAPYTKDGDAGATKNLVSNATLSEEVNGTPEGVGEYGDGNDYSNESRSEGLKGEGEDEEDEEDELEHPGEASVGKKLWKFFTT